MARCCCYALRWWSQVGAQQNTPRDRLTACRPSSPCRTRTPRACAPCARNTPLEDNVPSASRHDHPRSFTTQCQTMRGSARQRVRACRCARGAASAAARARALCAAQVKRKGSGARRARGAACRSRRGARAACVDACAEISVGRSVHDHHEEARRNWWEKRERCVSVAVGGLKVEETPRVTPACSYIAVSAYGMPKSTSSCRLNMRRAGRIWHGGVKG